MKKKIAVLIASSSKNTEWKDAEDALFLKHTIPSILRVKSNTLSYKFFVGVDDDDEFFLKNKREIEAILESTGEEFEIISIKNEARKPCFIWNYLFRVAYDKFFDYFLQTGDDVDYLNSFDLDFIKYLEANNNYGVAGVTMKEYYPLITQAFVHRKHMTLFGFLFPEELPDWGCDDWITIVYLYWDLALRSKEHNIKNNRIVYGKNDPTARYVVSENHRENLGICISMYKNHLHRIKYKLDGAI